MNKSISIHIILCL